MVLEFLLRHHERTGSATALAMVDASCTAMARGGLYDQLAGGFARYSVDAAWVVPHFEKMLYDNALLLRAYAHLARRTSAPLARRVAEETGDFLLRELRTAEGGFAASLDADADGVEGSTYVWTPEQLVDVLGADDGAWAAELFSVTADGTFEHGASTLQLRHDPDDVDRWQRVRGELLKARAGRPQPERDDKVVTAWNGPAIGALAEAGAALGRQEWIEAARQAADLLLNRHVVQGRLRRSSRQGIVGNAAAVLDDHGCLAEGLLLLHQSTAEPRWLQAACGLLDIALARFADRDTAGAFHDTADDAEQLVRRPSDAADNASPSGASALASALVAASALAGPERAGAYRAAAESAVTRCGLLATRAPRFAGHWLTVAEALRSGPVQVAVVGDAGDSRREALVAAARGVLPGGAVLLAGQPEAEGVPLLADRQTLAGAPAAYVCRGYVCDRPVTSAEELLTALSR
jgi:uncharacterized protein YyaL (SSP411 family)